jgi:hypothetical protein
VVIKAEDPARLVAYLSLKNVSMHEYPFGGEVALRLHCKAHMPAHQIPAAFVIVERFELTSSGKIDRLAMPKPPQPRSRQTVRTDVSDGIQTEDPSRILTHQAGDITHQAGDITYQTVDNNNNNSALRTATERIVAQTWASVLGVDDLKSHDNFWELGGTSVLAIQVIGHPQGIFSWSSM